MWFLYENNEDFVKHVYDTLVALPGNAVIDLLPKADNGGQQIDIYFEGKHYNNLIIDFNTAPNSPSPEKGGWEDRGGQYPAGYFNVQLGDIPQHSQAHYRMKLSENVNHHNYTCTTPRLFDAFIDEITRRISRRLFPDNKKRGK